MPHSPVGTNIDEVRSPPSPGSQRTGQKASSPSQELNIPHVLPSDSKQPREAPSLSQGASVGPVENLSGARRMEKTRMALQGSEN